MHLKTLRYKDLNHLRPDRFEFGSGVARWGRTSGKATSPMPFAGTGNKPRQLRVKNGRCDLAGSESGGRLA